MRSSPIRSAAALVAVSLAALLGACSSDSSVTPTNTNLDVSALVASASDANFSSGARSVASLPTTSAAPTVDPSQCPFSTANQDFECAPVTRNGLTFKTAYALLDGSGHALTAPNPATVAAVRARVDINGTTTIGTGNVTTLTLNSHGDHTLSGLLTNQRVLDGTNIEHDTTATTIGGATSRKAIDATTTTAALMIPHAAGQWPASGTITSDVKTASALGVGNLTTSIHAVTTFNGTSIVTTALTIGGHATTCKVDLSGKTAPVCG